MSRNPHHRVTSVYTLHVETAHRAGILLDAITPHLPPITDRGDVSVSWRSTDDATAAQEAHDALVAAGQGPAWVRTFLTTGLGVHRRGVEWPAGMWAGQAVK